MLSYQGGIRVPSYTASKSGVMGITRLMANERAQHKINVNAIAPGYMATNNTARCATNRTRPSSTASPPAAGACLRDLAGPVVFLASPASGLRQWLHRGRGWRLARMNIARKRPNASSTSSPNRGARLCLDAHLPRLLPKGAEQADLWRWVAGPHPSPNWNATCWTWTPKSPRS